MTTTRAWYVDRDGHNPLDTGFLGYAPVLGGQSTKAGNTGQAGANMGLSAVGVISPVPGMGLVLNNRADGMKQ